VSIGSPTSPTIITRRGQYEELVGKRIKHKWRVNDRDIWFYGQVLSSIPGTTAWYNIRYNEEEGILSLDLTTDLENGDLLVL
jgi:hypothetical protein